MSFYKQKDIPQFCNDCPFRQNKQRCVLVVDAFQRIPGRSTQLKKARNDFLRKYQKMFDDGEFTGIKQMCANAGIASR